MIVSCKNLLLLIVLSLGSIISVSAQKINRQAVVQRNNVVVKKADPLSSLTVGNGKFAFTVDVTGLQSFPVDYSKGVCLGTQSEWGWYSFRDTVGFSRKDALKTYQLNGKPVSYMVQWNSPEHNKAVSNWFRQNPYRLQLGNLGFEITKKDGTLAMLSDIEKINQQLNLWTGEIRSRFIVDGSPVDVSTFCHGSEDVISVKVSSPLVAEGRLMIKIVFPFPTGGWSDEGVNYESDAKHSTRMLISHANGAVLDHTIDTTSYYVGLWWKAGGSIKRKSAHYYLVSPDKGQTSFEFSAEFSPKKDFVSLPVYNESKKSSETEWKKFWSSGGAIDFSGSTDPRSKELERRIVLSQYLIRTQEAGEFPPQETGLTYNSWYGKPHLEMTWWHAAHYALWGRTELLEKSMSWYKKVAPIAREIATRQGFEGLRWQKMTDNEGNEVPSSVGAFLIWQQPHFIYFAEEVYRNKKDRATLEKYKDLVFETADFMASFPYYEKDKDRYILGKGLIPAQERFKAEETFNPTYELVYWKWAINVAQQWRERLKMGRNKKWDEVVKKLSVLPVQDHKYLFTESATDSYTNPEFKTDHPAVFGALGMLPLTGQVDTTIMKNTFNWIWNNWSWKDTWGWDFPLTAMTATRLNMPEKAIDALLMDIQTNTYLPNGHNYQDDRLRIYLPGNGGLLSAIALMCAGYDGSGINPGIPKKGWKVKWEGLKKMP